MMQNLQNQILIAYVFIVAVILTMHQPTAQLTPRKKEMCAGFCSETF